MANEPKNRAIEFALNDDRDFSGQKARPRFEAPASPPQPSLLGLVGMGHKLEYRSCVAVYIEAGEWVLGFPSDRAESVCMGETGKKASAFMKPFVDGFYAGLSSSPVSLNGDSVSVELIDGKFHFECED